MNQNNSRGDAPDRVRESSGLTVGCTFLILGAALLIGILALPINWLQRLIIPWMVEQLPWLFEFAGFLLALLQLGVQLATISLVVVVPVSLLLLIARQTRKAGLWGLRVYVAFTIFANVWLWSIIASAHLAGVLWLIIGLLLGGIGVIPIAWVAALVRADWVAAFAIPAGLALGVAIIFLAEWMERQGAKCSG